MSLWKWSRTAATNASADPSINWAEGQAPSSVNDSARATMAAVAKYRDDISGAIATSGTSTAYSVTSYQSFDTLGHLDGAMIAFTPHTTSGATVTLNVDGTGARPLRPSPGVELPSGALIQGTPYVATYYAIDGAFYLQGGASNPYNVPLGAGFHFWGTTAPNSAFAFAYGQAISRTTYATLFALFGTTFGTGDGSTTFNLPDVRGRVVAGKDDMGGSAASRLTSTYFGTGAVALGAVGGNESKQLTTGNIPSLTSSGNNSISVSFAGGVSAPTQASIGSAGANISGSNTNLPTSPGTWSTASGMSGTNSISVSYTNGAQTNVAIAQPTIIANYIIRII